MAKSVNKVILLGNAGKDPEVRATPSGVRVANLTLATSSRFKDNAGEWKEKTEWHVLVAYARLAEIVEQYVKKGSRIYVEGRLETRSWEDAHTKEKRYQTQVKMEELVLTGDVPNIAAEAPQRGSPVSAGHAQSAEHGDAWEDFR